MAVKVTVYGEANLKQIERARDELNKLEDAARKSSGGFAGSMAAIGGSLESVGSKMTATGQTLSRNVTVPIVAAGAAIGLATNAAAQDAQAQELLANTLRNTAGATDATIASTEAWIEAQGRALGVADDQLRPALGILSGATGDVAKAQELAALAMDISAAKGVDVETASNALAKAYGGNLGALKRLVPGIDEAAIKSGDFTQAQKALSEMVGGSAATAADTQAGKMEKAKVAIDEATESIGQAFLPIMETLAGILTDTVAPAIQAAADWFKNLDEGVRNTILVVAGIAAALGPALMAFGAVVNGAGALIKGLAAASEIATAAQWLWNAALTANPIGLVIAAIAALVAALVYFFTQTETGKKLWEDFVGAVTKLWEQFTQWITKTLDSLAAWWNGVWGSISSTFSAVWDGIIAYVRTVITIFVTIWSTAWNTLKAVFTTIVNGITGFFSGLKDEVIGALRGADDWLVSAGRDIVTGLLNGIKGAWSSITDWITGAVQKLVGGVKKLFGIKSPSTVFMTIGEQVGQGLQIGISSMTGAVTKAATGLAEAASVSATQTVGLAMQGASNVSMLSPAPALAVVGGGGTNRTSTVTIAQGAVQVNVTGGDSQTVGASVQEAFEQLIRELRAG